MSNPTDQNDPLAAIAADAWDQICIDLIVDVLLKRDGGSIPRERLPEAVLTRYQEDAAIALRGSDSRSHWAAVYYALENWVGNIEDRQLAAERVDLVRVVSDIVAAYKAFLKGDIPAEFRERFARLATEDQGRRVVDKDGR